jgi:tetratricopeptide (TPR) repeat protein
LGQSVLKSLDTYSFDKLTGQLGAEFGAVIDEIANRQLLLKKYSAAEASYQKALSLVLHTKDIDEKLRGKLVAGVYHNLGRVAQEQREFEQAEQYYQHALQIYIEYNDRYAQADTYHQLGSVAQEQREFEQAEQYYQQALQLKIEYNDRYAQASTYGQLGNLAQEQRQWQQAEVYYQQALQVFIEYKDRYSQAGAYNNLGMVAQEQQHWSQAGDYLLRALEIFVDYEDDHSIGIAVSSLARLWKASGDASLPAAVATILGASVEETEKLLREMLEEE